MSDTLAVATVPSASIVPTSGDNFELSATSPTEMVECHAASKAWCARKIEAMQAEAALLHSELVEITAALDHARKQKWSIRALTTAVAAATKRESIALGRVEFYRKMLAAFEAGYYIVPNFPVTLFAIRTDKPTPKRLWVRCEYSRQANFEQSAQALPVGEGQYRNPQPSLAQTDYLKTDKGNTWGFHADCWNKLDFPANMARLKIMESANRAMDAKIFDEVGFLPADYRRNPDPLLIGRIIDPRPNKTRVNFILAWHIDTKNL